MKQNIAIFVREIIFVNQYFGQLLEGLEAEFNIYVFHTTKLDKGKNEQSKYQDYDISSWSHFKIRNCLVDLSLKSLLITNIRSLIDIYMIGLCNLQNISLTYIEHGVSLNKMSVFKVKNKVHSVIKYVNYLLKVIPYVLLEGRRRVKIFGIYQAFVNASYNYFSIDKALFYTPEGKKVLQRFFSLNKLKVKYSGYPIVDSEEELKLLENKDQKKQVLYIHQPLIIDRFSSLSFYDEVKIILEIKTICKSLGYDFIMKLHPRDNEVHYKENLSNMQVFGGEVDVHKVIAESQIVLGHFSTALFTAIILKKELYILDNWKINIDSVLYFNSLNRTVKTIDEFRNLFSLGNPLDSVSYESFHKEKIGLSNTHEDRIEKLRCLLLE